MVLKITCHAHNYFVVVVHANILKKTDGKCHYWSKGHTHTQCNPSHPLGQGKSDIKIECLWKI